MKILLSSYAFYPSVGGLESLSAMLAEQLAINGHEVVVLTNTPNNSGDESAPYKVARRPSNRELFYLVKWCDVFLHNNINLRSSWPLLILRRQWVIINSGSISRNLLGKFKRFCATRFAVSSGVSKDAAQKIGSTRIIHNCYDDDLFREFPGVHREVDLVFLGRLVAEKGIDVLLRALRDLKVSGLCPRLTLVGQGPEEQPLRALADSFGIGPQVTFAGAKRGVELVHELNRHRVLVLPSVCDESFGIVALEGIASGCVVVGSDRGGIPEAIGPCGMVFRSGDHAALAESLKNLLTDPQKMAAMRNHAAGHLSRFTKKQVVNAYLRLLESLR